MFRAQAECAVSSQEISTHHLQIAVISIWGKKKKKTHQMALN